MFFGASSNPLSTIGVCSFSSREASTNTSQRNRVESVSAEVEINHNAYWAEFGSPLKSAEDHLVDIRAAWSEAVGYGESAEFIVLEERV